MPPQCVAEDCKIPGKPILAYRLYYWRYKKRFAKWQNNVVPLWWSNKLDHL